MQCFDCLQLFPPFSSSAGAGAKKALSKLSRPNTPALQGSALDENYSYGPPLKHDLDQEDLPELSDHEEKEVSQIDDVDSGTGELETISDNSSMDPATGMELDAVVLVDMDKDKELATPEETPADDNSYASTQEVDIEEIETSLDDQLPAAETSQASSSDVTNDTVSTVRSEQKLLPADGAKKENQPKTKVVGHLEVNLEYDEDGGRLKVAVMKASDLPSKKQGGFNNYRVRIHLKPNKQQSSKTKIRPADSPVFRELFRFRQVPKDGLSTFELLFKLQGCGKYGKEKFVADATLNLTALKAVTKQTFNLPLSYSEVVEQ